MQEKYCSNCGRNTGHKRAIGWGTFFAVLITGGFWFLAIPFYPKRCIMCGGTTVGHITKSADHSGTSNDALINSKDQFKKCPLCAEDIKLEALKCRYCSEEFDPDAVAEEIESVKLKSNPPLLPQKINIQSKIKSIPKIAIYIFIGLLGIGFLGQIASGLFDPIDEGIQNKNHDEIAQNKKQEATNSVKSAKAQSNEDIYKNVKLLFDLRYGGIDEGVKMGHRVVGITGISDIYYPMGDPVLEIMMRFENHNSFGIKDIKYICYHFAESGKLVDTTKGTRYIAMDPNSHMYREINFGFIHSQSSVIKCECTGFSSAQN
jgi:hypothetical protein